MSRNHPLIATVGLFALLALGGVFNGPTGLLMVAPFLLLISLLLAGQYPGEEVIARFGRALHGQNPRRARHRSLPPAPVFLLRDQFLLLACGTRGPPRFVRP